MGRPAGSKNKPRAPTASGSAPLDHNASKAKEGLTDDQKRVLFLRLVEQAEEEKDAIASHTANLRNIYKTARSDLGTQTPAQIRAAIRMRQDEPKERARIQAEIQAARWIGAAFGTQFDFFEDRTPSADKAQADGKTAGLAGKDAKPPFAPGTEQYERWMDGYQEGQRVNIAGIRQKDGEEFDRTNHDQAAADEAHSPTDPTIAETIHAADPFGDGVGDLTDRDLPLDPEASANQTANVTPISNGRSKRNGRGSKDAEPVTAA